jgi:NAD(P)-dependent dehydrogenase (short-subunit alcohol dehydrogenase family)
VGRRVRPLAAVAVNARLAQPRLVALSAAKAALSNPGKALAEEFAGRGLRVNTTV